jgi:hypothetical protein
MGLQTPSLSLSSLHFGKPSYKISPFLIIHCLFLCPTFSWYSRGVRGRRRLLSCGDKCVTKKASCRSKQEHKELEQLALSLFSLGKNPASCNVELDGPRFW